MLSSWTFAISGKSSTFQESWTLPFPINFGPSEQTRIQEVVRRQNNSVYIKRSCTTFFAKERHPAEPFWPLIPWEVPWLLPAAHCWATSCVVESTAPWAAERWLVEMFKIQRKQRSSLLFLDIDLQAKLHTKAYILYVHISKSKPLFLDNPIPHLIFLKDYASTWLGTSYRDSWTFREFISSHSIPSPTSCFGWHPRHEMDVKRHTGMVCGLLKEPSFSWDRIWVAMVSERTTS